jgi:hypothetical protein
LKNDDQVAKELFDWWDNVFTSLFVNNCNFPNENNSDEMDTILLRFCQYHYTENHKSDSLYATLDNAQGIYDRNISDVWFLMGDNTAINPGWYQLIKCPFIGCAIHKLNLCVRDYFNEYDD